MREFLNELTDKQKYILMLVGVGILFLLVGLSNSGDNDSYEPMTEKERENQEWLIEVYND